VIESETDEVPLERTYDLAIVAVGYERRCRWVVNKFQIDAKRQLGLEFGFLAEGSYQDNRKFFEDRSYEIIPGLDSDSASNLSSVIASLGRGDIPMKIFVDISSMSREMIANVALGLQGGRLHTNLEVTAAYAPSDFVGPYLPAPIRIANPIKPQLAGWSSQPERPLGAIFGLGCEPGLALGALQFLEPKKAWIFAPKGIDPKFDTAMRSANAHIDEIFDVTNFLYDITYPTRTRGRFEALLNAVDTGFRVIAVPFGPKLFAWLTISTVVFLQRSTVGVWAFSSKEHAQLVDRDAQGTVIWHSFLLQTVPSAHSSID
jgi:hypothetical protein